MNDISIPEITVLMTIYNEEKYVKEAIFSILNQTYADFEFLIINDGSTDQSLQIIQEIFDDRIKIINKENQGLTKSLNFGIKISKGRFIARQDADDYSHPERLEKQYNLANQAVIRYKNHHPEKKVDLLVVNGVEHSIIPIYINAGDVIIVTSTHEGSPTVVKEALSCKVPVLSFNVGDVEERIGSIKGCFICNERSVACLEKGLEIVLSHDRLQDIPEASLKQINERENVMNIIGIYKELFHGKDH